MQIKKQAPKSTKELLSKYDFVARLTEKVSYSTTEHQDFGLRLAGQLGDLDHRTLYIKLAKDLPRGILDQAVSFALDYPEKKGDGNKGRIFMWKLKQLCLEKNILIPSGTRKPLSRKKQLQKTQMKMFK